MPIPGNSPCPTPEEIYNEYAAVLYGTALRLTADEDCAQRVFIKACAALWASEAGRTSASLSKMIREVIRYARDHCAANNTTRLFEQRMEHLLTGFRHSAAQGRVPIVRNP